MNFDLTDLRLFVAAAEHRNLTRAAQQQHLSLAAASARIKAMESRAGLPLLAREARGVSLLPAGEAVLHHARLVLHQAERLRTDLLDYGAGSRGHVRVFANTTAVTDFLPGVLAAWLATNPGYSVDLREKPNPEIARDVVEGRADLGIVAGRVDTLGLTAIHFSTDRLVLAVPRGHRLARRRRIAFADTLQEPHVGMHAGSTLQAFLSQVTERLGRPLRLRVQLASFDAMCLMIGAGVGVGVVPESAASRHLDGAGLALVELTDEWRTRERQALVRSGEKLPAASQDLLDRLLEHYRVEAAVAAG
ncbi:MAG: LysR family transcriptional regulator [Burkholderiaceae bacterium]|nr:LysR family transcriptional regulator [Burkholderiaceae bacterium]